MYEVSKMNEFEGKKILILGMARSGIAAAELLHKNGAAVSISDMKEKDAFEGALDGILPLVEHAYLGSDVTEDMLKGKDLLVISPGVPIDVKPVLLAQSMNIPVTGEMEMASRLIKGELVAVTGTNGKTTTVTLLGEIFEAAGRNAYVCGNIGYPVSAAAMDAREGDVIVAEVSSFQLETVSTFHPLSAAVLNITEDHLNRHKTMQRYIDLKEHIFVNQTAEDTAVLNMDDPVTRAFAADMKGKVAFFSRKEEPAEGAFVRDGQIIWRANGEEKTVCAADEVYIPGPHNLENALAAVAVAASRGVPAAVIRHVLKTFKGVEHRIEFTRELDGIRYINDSKGTNTDSTIKAVEAMTRPTALILGGYDKHVSFVPLAKCIMEHELIRHCVLIGDTADQIERELRAEGYTAITRTGTMEDAILKCRDSAGDGWNVLLSPACASFDMFKDYEERGRVFKQIVNAL
ncbi:MAG: UDP-N-acetylmuramoyl-L-alanine--D-glutamate ligase [Clostridiales bacterium]|nr:UDP-N-acetylmuramoyl-L-alanine--D-glutamate ligase [Clostridiales bacterium]